MEIKEMQNVVNYLISKMDEYQMSGEVGGEGATSWAIRQAIRKVISTLSHYENFKAIAATGELPGGQEGEG